MYWTFNKECTDCKYYVDGKCTHPYAMYCNHCELWTLKMNGKDEVDGE